MWNKTAIRALCVFPVAPLIVIAGSFSLRAQESSAVGQDRELRGIDLVILVDISRSMSAGSGGGSDPERIRWDAVKMMLDLLGPSDRVMIQRFNEHCPPGFSSYGEPDDVKAAKENLEKHKFLNSEMTFDEKLLPLTKENRIRIARKIDSFNRVDDDQPGKKNSPEYNGLLDQGYTAIVGALEKVAAEIGNASTVRSPHVVLLTDGLDSHVKGGSPYDGGPELKQRFREVAELREALTFFDRRDELGNGEVPIHIIGLRLKSEGEERAELARLLLTRIASLSGGQFFEVPDSAKLIEGYVKLIREIKGYWDNEIRYDPDTGKTYDIKVETQYAPKSGMLHEVETRRELSSPRSLVVNGIRDLGILSYAKLTPSDVTNPKYSIQPPRVPAEFQWDSQAPINITAPEPRTGKGETLYHYTYYGPTAGQGKSPFAFPEFAAPGVTLDLIMRGEKLEQRLVLLKGTEVSLFSWGSPEAGAKLRRNQTLTIRVDMTRTESFAPGQFDALATVTPVGTGNVLDGDGGKAAGALVKLTPFVNAEGERGFTGRLHLLDLPRQDEGRDSYQVAVRIEGRGEPEIKKHGLSGSGRNLQPRLFSVENSLFVHPLVNIDLSDSRQSGQIEVKTVNPVEEDIELNVTIRRPASKKGEVAPKSLPITFSNGDPAKGKLVLKRGHATINVALSQGAKFERSVVYTPGSIKLSDPAGLLKPNSEEQSLESSIRLALDLARVRLTASQILLVAGETESTSRPLKVELKPATQPGFDGQTVTLTIQATKGSELSDDSKPIFGEDELWLARVGTSAVANGNRTQTLTGIKTNEEFRVHLHARENKTPGKYSFIVKATADWLVPVEAKVDIAVEAPEIQLDMESQTLYLSPGQNGQAVFKGWLTSALELSEQPVHVKDAFVGRQVGFKQQTADDSESKFNVACAHIDRPVVLKPGEESAQFLSFDIRVPPDTKYGRYFAEFTLTGPNVLPKKLKLHVIVNALEMDLASTDAVSGKGIWRLAREDEVFQLDEVPMTQWLRVRTGLGDRFESEDQISIVRAGPFQDDNGDQQRLPTVETKTLSTDRRSVLLKIAFPKVRNFNGLGEAYTIAIVTTANGLHVPDERFTFRVRYLRVRDVLKSTNALPSADQNGE